MTTDDDEKFTRSDAVCIILTNLPLLLLVFALLWSVADKAPFQFLLAAALMIFIYIKNIRATLNAIEE